jgi:hypothetical protein
MEVELYGEGGGYRKSMEFSWWTIWKTAWEAKRIWMISFKEVGCEDGNRMELIWGHVSQHLLELAVLNIQVATIEVVRWLVAEMVVESNIFLEHWRLRFSSNLVVIVVKIVQFSYCSVLQQKEINNNSTFI